MQYLIMLMIVIGLAIADWLTGFIKGYASGTVSSKVMRTGGVKKLAEIIVMLVGIGIDIAIQYLSIYYPNYEWLGSVLGNVCAIGVCGYITIMELVSILENFAAIYPEANWAKAIAKRLTNIDKKEETEE